MKQYGNAEAMKIEKIQEISLKDIVLVSSLPDMGKVGGLVTQHLTKTLKAKPASKIILRDKPWVNLKNGIVNLPTEEYHLSADENNSIVIFTGQNQPQEPRTVFEMAKNVISEVKKLGNIKMIISTGGYLPAQNDTEVGVFGVATNSDSLKMLKKLDIEPLSSQVNTITWFNGLILGFAKNSDIDGIGLFGKIQDPDSPQYEAAKNVIKCIEKILHVPLDTKELEKKIPEKTSELKKEGPGIG